MVRPAIAMDEYLFRSCWVRLLCLVSFLFLCSLSVYSQRTISGVVILEDDQMPLPGVGVFQKGVEGGYRRFRGSLKYYKLGSFSEFSLGIGYRIGYRLRKRYAEQHRF